ncbi:MAG: LpxI family protein [Roseobacter sp.]
MLALISGRGALPAYVAEASPQKPLICVLEGFEPDRLEADITFRLEHLGTLLKNLKARGVREVCFCGAIERPPFDPKALDAATLPLVPVIVKAMGSGDDAALRAVMTVFEAQGFSVRAAHDIAPGLLAPEGMLTSLQPDDAMQADVIRADAILTALSPLDVGQGCVVGAGQVWAIETIGGTDHMLSSLPGGAQKVRAVLVKTPKVGQDVRADLPTIGPDTIDAVVTAGLAGIVITAGAVILLDAEVTCHRAQEAGLVLWSRAGG